MSDLKLCLILLVLAQAAPSLSAQNIRPIDTLGLAAALPWANTITPAELKEHAYILASDSLQGRETGTEGQRLAANYLSSQMLDLGLPRVGESYSYEQRIAFERARWDRVRLSVEGEEFRHLRDFYGFPGEAAALDESFPDAIFLGYGIDAERYSDYRAAGDLSGQVAIVLGGEPFSKRGISQVTGTADTSAWSRELSLKLAAARQARIKVLLIVESNMQAAIAANRAKVIDNSMRVVDPKDLMDGEPSMTVLHISPKVLTALVGKNRKQVIKARKRMAKRGNSAQVPLQTELVLELNPVRSQLTGSNVLGYIRGSDPELADELIVISAHYDHLGQRPATVTDTIDGALIKRDSYTVYNGADDNASGTSTVLEIAEAFAAAQRAGQGPKRSVLTLFVSGEEKGLLGSEFYAANPVFPLAQTVADINIDMIGRYDEAHNDSLAYIYVIGAGRISPDLDSVTVGMNRAYSKYELDYTFDAEDDPNRFYYRSDHYNFAKNGIPSVFFFSGVHEDYHRPSDTPDKLDYDKMTTVGRHAFLIGWNLANRPGKLNRK